MLKYVLLSIAVIYISMILEGLIGTKWNMPGFGTLFAVVTMGSFILYAIEKKGK